MVLRVEAGIRNWRRQAGVSWGTEEDAELLVQSIRGRARQSDEPITTAGLGARPGPACCLRQAALRCDFHVSWCLPHADMTVTASFRLKPSGVIEYSTRGGTSS